MSLPACITLRTVKGSVLSWGELDNNFVCLNNSINSLASVIGNGNRWHIPSGTTLTIETDYQHFIYGDMLIEGVLQLSGGSQLVVLNGNVVVSGGTIVGPGTIYNITLSGNSVTAANLYWVSGSTGNYSIKADNNSGLDATGDYSTAIGYNTLSSGLYSFSQGYNTQSNGIASYAGGNNTITSGDFQHVVGKFNLPVLSDSSFIIGNGTNSFNPSNLVLATGNDFIVYGRTVTDDFRMTSGATNGYILTSDAIGNASWQSLPVITGNSVTCLTFNNSNFDLTIGTTSGDFTQSLSILATDMTVTGGTYNPSTGIATFTTNSGNTFNISGFLTGYTDISVSAITYDSITGTLNLLQTDSSILTATGFTNNDFYVTGGTLVGGTLTLERQDGVVTIPGFASSFTGNTSGDCITDLYVSNVNSCSPLHIQPINNGDVYISESGGTVGVGTNSPNTLFTLDVNGDTNVNGLLVSNNIQLLNGATNGYILTSDALGNGTWSPNTSVTGLTFNTINYDLTVGTTSGDFTQNLGILASDMTITGGTYNPSTGSASFTNNSGGTFTVTGFLTGYTDIKVSGFTYNNANTITLLQGDNSTLSASINIVTGLTSTGDVYINNVRVGKGANSIVYNTVLGEGALSFSGNTGGSNIAIGFDALKNNATGVQNIGIGINALRNNTTGFFNTGLGYFALQNNTTGSYNLAIGYGASTYNTTGSFNTSIGQAALGGGNGGGNPHRGNYNTAIGRASLLVNTSGNTNTAVGNDSLRSNTIGSNNVSLGHNSLFSNTTGSGSTAIGYFSLYSNTTASNNVAIGNNALRQNLTGIQNTAIGYFSLYNNTNSNNTSLGFSTLQQNTSGPQNTGVGSSTLQNNINGGSNTAVGYLASQLNTSASNNVSIGVSAGRNTTTGGNNTSIGANALLTNTLGTSNTALGINADVTSNNLTNATAIGANAKVATSNSLVLGSNANVGVGTTSPTERLDVSGKTKTINFQMTSGATNGYVLTSDASGNGKWLAPSGGGAAANLYWVSGSTGNYSIKADNNSGLDATGDYSIATGFNTLAAGLAAYAGGNNTIANGNYQHVVGKFNNPAVSEASFIIGNGVSIVSTSNLVLATGNDFIVYGNIITDNFRMTSGATNGYVLTSDASGNGIWLDPSGGGGTFTGNTSATCITDLFVSNVNSCSPLHVQSTSSGDVLIGENGGVNVGIGLSTLSSEKLEVSGNTKLSSLSNVFKISSYTALGMSQGVGVANVFIGGGTVTDGANGGGISIGSSSTTYGDGVSIGQTAKADSSGGDAIAIGRNSTANGTVRSIAIGRDSTSSASNAWALGYNAKATQDNTFIFGDSSDINIKSGFGTDTPESRIHIKGSDSSSSNYGLKVQNSGGTDNFVVRNDGNVGIGTSTPTETLEVVGKTKTNNLQIYDPYIPTGSTDPTGSIGDISLSGDVLFWKDSTQWYRISGQTW